MAPNSSGDGEDCTEKGEIGGGRLSWGVGVLGSNFIWSIQAVPATLLSNFPDGWRITSIRRSLVL
jgi:hypothetical protein